MIEFQNAEVIINRSGLMADSATLSSSNALSPVYVLGIKDSVFDTPAGNLTSNLNISYTPEANWEPNLQIIENITKNHSNYHWQPETGSIAGISGYFYLESFSLRCSPNDIVKANVSYTSFQMLTGNILLDRSNSVNYNDHNSTGIMHGYSTIVNLSQSTSPPIYEFSYDFRANWVPTYSLGRVHPTQVQLAGGTETLTFVRDIYSGIYFSGEDSMAHLSLRTPNTTVKLTGVSYVNSIMDGQVGYFYEINCSGAVINNELIATINDIIKVKTTVQKYF